MEFELRKHQENLAKKFADLDDKLMGEMLKSEVTAERLYKLRVSTDLEFSSIHKESNNKASDLGRKFASIKMGFEKNLITMST